MPGAIKTGSSRRAIIIGGSMGGLFAALLLLQRGWDVQVHERVAQPLSGRGAGIVTHPQLWRILERLGLDPATDFGVEVQDRITLAQDGSVAGVFPCPQTMTSWDRLFRLLRAALPDDCYAMGQELRRVEAGDGGVTVHFADGHAASADLLVAADGFRSGVRQHFLGDLPPNYAGYTAWRGLVAEAEMPEAARALLFPVFGFCLPPGEQMLGYPVAGADNDLRPGHRRYNFVWYRPANEAVELPQLLTDAAGHTHALSIPPPLIRAEVVAAMRAAAEQVLAPQFAAIVRATRQPFLQPIYDIQSPRLTFPSTALLGDSAFVARPHVGAGVTKAAQDALALAEALEAAPDIATALAQYEAIRAPAGERVMQRARHLGAYMQAQLRTAEERAAALRHHPPAAVMAETALLNF